MYIMVDFIFDINFAIVSKLMITKEAVKDSLRHELRHSVEAINYSFTFNAKHRHCVYNDGVNDGVK